MRSDARYDQVLDCSSDLSENFFDIPSRVICRLHSTSTDDTSNNSPCAPVWAFFSGSLCLGWIMFWRHVLYSSAQNVNSDDSTEGCLQINCYSWLVCAVIFVTIHHKFCKDQCSPRSEWFRRQLILTSFKNHLKFYFHKTAFSTH